MGRMMEPMTIITTRVPAYPLTLLANSYTAPTQPEWASNNVRSTQIYIDSLVPAMAGPAASPNIDSLVPAMAGPAASLPTESLVPAMAGPAISLQIMIRYPDRYPTFTISHQRQHLLYKVLEPAVPSTPDLLAPVTSPHLRHLLQPTYHNSCILSTGHCVITHMPSFMLSHRLYTSPMVPRSLHLDVLSALRCAPLDWFRECRGAGSGPPRP